MHKRYFRYHCLKGLNHLTSEHNWWNRETSGPPERRDLKVTRVVTIGPNLTVSECLCLPVAGFGNPEFFCNIAYFFPGGLIISNITS